MSWLFFLFGQVADFVVPAMVQKSFGTVAVALDAAELLHAIVPEVEVVHALAHVAIA